MCGLGVLEIGLVRHVVDLRQHHAGLHAGAEVDRIAVGVLAEAHDLAVDLGADVYELFGFDGAGGGNGADDVGAEHFLGLEDDFHVGFAAGIAAQDDPANGENAEYDDEDKEFFQELFHVKTAFMLCLILILFLFDADRIRCRAAGQRGPRRAERHPRKRCPCPSSHP